MREKDRQEYLDYRRRGQAGLPVPREEMCDEHATF